jgi:dienelactone hydrolase
LTARVALGLALAAGALAAVWPAATDRFAFFPLPAPAGPYPVGTTVRTIAATPPYAVQIWYPAANVSGAARAGYRFSERAGAPLRSQLIWSLVRAGAYLDPGVAGGRFPVVLYFPAWGDTRGDNTALAQSLASRGFVVVATDDFARERPLDLSSAEAYRASVQWAERKVRLSAERARLTLAALAGVNATDPQGRFTGHLRLDKVGAVGFSFGGAVAAELATLDPSVAAAVDLDGWLFGDAARDGVPRPFLMVSTTGPPFASGPSAPPEQRNSAALDAANGRLIEAGLARYGGYALTISGTAHLNLCDVPFYPSLRRTGTGSIDGARAAKLAEAYVAQFLSRNLEGTAAPLFAPGPADAAVSLRHHRGSESPGAAY